MDPRHTLYRTFDQLTVDSGHPDTMSARTDEEAAQVQATSGVTPESIEKKLKEGLGAVYVEIADLSGMCIFMLSAVRVIFWLIVDLLCVPSFHLLFFCDRSISPQHVVVLLCAPQHSIPGMVATMRTLVELQVQQV
jgi:hypothetical protein